MRYRLVAIDVDGTLLNDQYKLPPRTKETMNRSLDYCHLVLCTGRSLFSTKPLLQHFKKPIPLISDNGGTLWLPEKGIWEQSTISRQVVQEILSFCREYGLHVDFTTGEGIYVERLNEQLLSIYRKYFAEPTKVRDLMQLEQMPVKITISGPTEQIDQAYPEIIKRFAEKAQCFRSGPYFIDCLAKGVNKGTALMKVASFLGVDMRQTIAIGNYFNDLEMLHLAGLGVAVANAPEEVRGQADLVTDSNNHEGVRKVLEKFILTSPQ